MHSFLSANSFLYEDEQRNVENVKKTKRLNKKMLHKLINWVRPKQTDQTNCDSQQQRTRKKKEQFNKSTQPLERDSQN